MYTLSVCVSECGAYKSFRTEKPKYLFAAVECYKFDVRLFRYKFHIDFDAINEIGLQQ